MEKGIIRIAFTGPESCGKTTLATWCAAFFNWPLAQEYARTYLETRPLYKESDLIEMAKGQQAWWPLYQACSHGRLIFLVPPDNWNEAP